MRGSFVANRASARRTILAMGFLIAALPACGGGGGSGASEVGAAEQFGVGPLAYEYGDEDLPVASAEEVADLFPATELFVDGTISIVPTDDEAPIAIPKGRRVGAPPLPFSVPRLPGDETLEGIAFDPTRNGVPAAFVTSAGRLFLYDARGDSWSVKRTEPAQALRGIAAFKRGEQLELVAAGTFGRAWYSPDAGASWTQKSMPTPGHLNVVATCPMGISSTVARMRWVRGSLDVFPIEMSRPCHGFGGGRVLGSGHVRC